MNSDTGEIKYFKANEIIKPPWIPCGQPNPDCQACGGKGSILYDVSKTLYANRAERRRAMKAGLPTHKYLPCPECAGKK
jgi:hypothetical protein